MQVKNNTNLLKKMCFQVESQDIFKTNKELFSGVGIPCHYNVIKVCFKRKQDSMVLLKSSFYEERFQLSVFFCI